MSNVSGTNVSGHPERRRHPRCKAAIPVELHMPGVSTPSRTTTREISVGGCYIETTFTIAVGTRLTMKLWLNDAPMDVSCVVVTCHPQFGNGFELWICAKKIARGSLYLFETTPPQLNTDL